MIVTAPSLIADGSAAAAAPTSLATDFPGALLLLGDPYAPNFEPVTEVDRIRWRDTSGCENDVWASDTAIITPWNGGAGSKPTTAAIDGHQVPFFDGGDDSMSGYLTGTPTGENLFKHSELFDSPWTYGNVVPTPGPAPFGLYLGSTRLTDSGSGLHYATQTAEPTVYQNGRRFSFQITLAKAAGYGWFCINIDNHSLVYVDLNTGTLGTISGSGHMVDQTTGATYQAGTQVSGPHDLVRISSEGGGRYKITFTIVANSTAGGNALYLFLAAADNVISFAANGSAVDVSGVSLRPARTLTVPRYHRSTSSYLVNGTFSACTFVVVAVSTSGGPRGIVDVCNDSWGTNTGPRVGTDTGVFHTQGVKAAGTDYNYVRATGNLDCHTVIADPGVGTWIYRNGVMVASSTCTTWNKPAFGVRVGRLFQDVWHLAGKIPVVGLWPFAQDHTTFPALVSAKLRAAPAYPSIAA